MFLFRTGSPTPAILPLLIALLCSATTTSATQAAPSSSLAMSQQIDAIIDSHFQAQEEDLNPPIDDETFMRRIYIDAIGRIPTYSEAITFLLDSNPQKRTQLIERLLDSPGYESQQFNYWADILRLKTQGDRKHGGESYAYWVREAIAQNIPYDQFVTALLTAEGYPWENGAVGYYMRDFGMPLDNMANTTRIFLGTRIECAQCHDHPFDNWTQKEFYELSAYTYGLTTRTSLKQLDSFHDIQKIINQSKLTQKEKKQVRSSATKIFRPLQFKVTATDRSLKLPDDYQYKDAAPQSKVSAHPLWGEIDKQGPQKSKHRSFAQWLTAPDNPRFTRVIANRMWKKTIGVGLIEPVDDIRSDSEIAIPELMSYLEEAMQNVDYDLKAFQQIIFNTQFYQRTKNGQNATEGKTYSFTGPLLQRMTAEQLWDSLLTLTVENLDTQKANPPNQNNLYAHARHLLKIDPRDAARLSNEIAQAENAINKKRTALRTKIKAARETGDTATHQKLSRQIRNLEKERKQSARKLTKKYLQASSEEAPSMMMSARSQKSTNKNFIRASELPSPAKDGHFLLEFGQSERETIESSTQEASIPQALYLMNGKFHKMLHSENSLLTQRLKTSRNAPEKLDVLYLSIIGRSPSLKESELLLPKLENDSKKGAQQISWALLNTRQFMFVQ